jgi:hypothetical protein
MNSTATSDDNKEYFVSSPSGFRLNNSKLTKISDPASELVVSLIVNQEEYLLRALADTGASTNSILEGYKGV